MIRFLLRFFLFSFRLLIYFKSLRISNSFEFIIEWEVFRVNRFSINLIFILDLISLYFIRLVRLVSGRVMIFRTNYMISEKFFSRFIILVFFFILSIYLLILRPNLIRLLLGWDGLGVTSYLLVIFYQRNKSYNAGMLTAITNRLGDVGLLVRISMIIFIGSWNFIYLNFYLDIFSELLVYLIIISACTKRAQIPFSAWLPAAIAAPTPVSALVHSSTLVTAGVYLLIRINMIIININISYILIIIGILTIVIAGITAIIEIDMKKIIALSTLSQLGVIIIILGSGNPVLSFFHLISHAFFKAILFMCAGLIIHNIKDYQDIRKIGFRLINLNFSISIMMIANIRLCGLPFLRGFYSKDLIIEIMFIGSKNFLVIFLLILGTGLTVIYSCRLNFLVALNFIKLESYYFISESSKLTLVGMFFLLPFSIIGGIIISWNIIRANKIIFFPMWMKMLIPMVIISCVIVFCGIFYKIKNYNKSIVTWFMSNIWFLPISLNVSITNLFLNSSTFFFKKVEMTWSELIVFKNFYAISMRLFNKFLDYLSFIYVFQSLEIFILLLVLFILFI